MDRQRVITGVVDGRIAQRITTGVLCGVYALRIREAITLSWEKKDHIYLTCGDGIDGPL